MPTAIMSSFKYLGPTTYSPGTYTAWCPTGLIFDSDRDVYAHFMFVRATHYSAPDQIQLWFNTINPDTLAHSEPVYVGDGAANVTGGGGFIGTCIKDGIYYAFSVGYGYYTSEDGGKTWTHNDYETAPSGTWGCYVLENGRMIMGSDNGASVNYCSVSDDNGKNWRKINVTGIFDEPTFVEFGSGVIMAIIRQQVATSDPCAKPYFRVSTDYGETWTDGVEMQSVGEMNANNCNAYVHDNYVELFVGCRIPSTNSDYTGTIYRINQYVLDRNKGAVDEFEFVNTVYDYQPENNDWYLTGTDTGDFSTPCIAIKNKSQALMMFYGPCIKGVTHHLIAVGNVSQANYSIPSIIPTNFTDCQIFSGASDKSDNIISICEAVDVDTTKGNYPYLAYGYLKISDIKDGGFIHIGSFISATGNLDWDFPCFTNVKNGKLKSGLKDIAIPASPMPVNTTSIGISITYGNKKYPQNTVYDMYAFMKDECWWVYYDGSWWRTYQGDYDLSLVTGYDDSKNYLKKDYAYYRPYSYEGLTEYTIFSLPRVCSYITAIEYDKQ